MNKQIPAYEAKSKFSEIIKWVAASKYEATITLHGKPTVKIIPYIDTAKENEPKIFQRYRQFVAEGVIQPGVPYKGNIIDSLSDKEALLPKGILEKFLAQRHREDEKF